MKMGNKSYFTYKRAEQEEILKKIEENYKFPVKFVFCRRKRSQKKSNWKRIEKKRIRREEERKLQQRITKRRTE